MANFKKTSQVEIMIDFTETLITLNLWFREHSASILLQNVYYFDLGTYYFMTNLAVSYTERMPFFALYSVKP